MKVTSLGYKEEDKHFRINAESVFWQQLDQLPNGKYQIAVEKYKRTATHQQFKYLYSTVYPLSLLALNNAGYEFTNIDQVDNFWKGMFANKEFLPMSKSEFMTIDEMAYTDAIRNYCSEYLGTNIPDPNPQWKSKKKENDYQI